MAKEREVKVCARDLPQNLLTGTSKLLRPRRLERLFALMIKSRRDLRRPVLRLGESYDMTRSSAMLPGRTPRIHQWCPRVSEGISPLGAWPIPRKIGPGRPNVSSIVRKSGKRSPPAHVYCRSRSEKASSFATVFAFSFHHRCNSGLGVRATCPLSCG